VGRIPPLKPREVIAILNKLGFTETRQLAQDIGLAAEQFLEHR
jgi:hypothetical protein